MRYGVASALIGLMVALGYWYLAPECFWCETMHREILNGTAGAPFRFRLVAPVIASAMPAPGVALQYVMAHAISVPAVFLAVWAWLRGEVGDRAALIGCYVLAAHMLIGFYQYGLALYSLIEIGMLALGLIWLRTRGAGVGYALLVVLGTLNRETTGLLLVLAASTSPPAPLRGRGVIGAVAAFAATLVGLRLILGGGTDGQSIGDVVAGNLRPERLLAAAINHLALIPAVVMVGAVWQSGGDGRRRLVMVGLPYAVMVLVFGYWDEVRLWMPVVLLAMPVMLRVGADGEGHNAEYKQKMVLNDTQDD